MMLCRYDCELYRDALSGWTVHQVDTMASGKCGGIVRCETICSNRCAEDGRRQASIDFNDRTRTPPTNQR